MAIEKRLDLTRYLGLLKIKIGKELWKTMGKTKYNINWKFKIPWNELCPKCFELLKARKREQERVNNRQFMALFRLKNKTKAK